jgi:hypothetical protein
MLSLEVIILHDVEITIVTSSLSSASLLFPTLVISLSTTLIIDGQLGQTSLSAALVLGASSESLPSAASSSMISSKSAVFRSSVLYVPLVLSVLWASASASAASLYYLLDLVDPTRTGQILSFVLVLDSSTSPPRGSSLLPRTTHTLVRP